MEHFKELETAVQNVDPRKQLKPSECVTYENLEGSGLRVMFVGNSITLHGIAHEIGWHDFWGMAASAKEKDYVHLCISHLNKTHRDAAYCICQAANWERDYRVTDFAFDRYENARDFEADVIVVKLCANSPAKDFEPEKFAENFPRLMDYLNKTGKAKFVICTEFYNHPAEPVLRQYAESNSYPVCHLSDLSEKPEMMALGLFEHEGVAHHPGDLGMATIAQRVCAVLDAMEI